MAHILILSLSFAIQLLAATLALRLIFVTGRRFAWIALAVALALMSVRRGISLGHAITEYPDTGIGYSAEIVALGISLLMLMAVTAIKPIFESASASDRIENRFGRVLDSSLHEIYIFNADSLRFIEVNHGAQENLGYSATELKEMTPVDLKPEFDDATFRELLEPLRRGEQDRVRFSARHRRKDGTEYPVEVDLQLAREIDEPAFIAVIRDVSEKARAEEALAESNAQFRALIEHVQDVITEVDEKGQIVYHSPSIERIMGYRPDYRVGRNATEFVHPHDVEHVSNTLTKLLEGSAPRFMTYRLRHRDGSWRTMEAVGSTRLLASGKKHAVVTQRDVTERKLTDARLQQSQKLETIGTLAGGIAHDFNNILSPVLGYTQLLRDELGDEKLRSYADEILLATEQARQLVGQILTFSRRGEQQRRPVDFPRVVEEALRLVRFSLPATIDLQVQINTDAGVVIADETQLHQVIMNLCTNAHQAMKPDRGTLAVSVEREDLEEDDLSSIHNLAAGPYVRLTVRDTGHGMDEKVLERMFEPFFTTRGATGGTGLGLSVAHGIVASHGGDMTVESEIGKGTTFHVRLPCVPGGTEEPEKSAPEASRGAGQHIMLVDDEQAVAAVLSAMLEHLGYRVTSILDPAEALTRFRLAPDSFDLVITDQTMPGMTGLQLSAEIRQLRADIHILIASGFSEDLDTARTDDLGIHAVLRKPFDMATIDQEVRSAFNPEPEHAG